MSARGDGLRGIAEKLRAYARIDEPLPVADIRLLITLFESEAEFADSYEMNMAVIKNGLAAMLDQAAGETLGKAA